MLSEFTVVEIASTCAGSYAGRILAESGFQVLRIEIDSNPIMQQLPPFTADGQSIAYVSANAKKAIVNIDSLQGRELIFRLIANSDVFITDQEDWFPLRASRVTCHVHPYAGVLKGFCDLPSADVLVQAESGAVSMTGHLTGPPVTMGFPIGDVAPGMFSAMGILNELLNDEPGLISVRALDALVSLLSYLGCSFMVDGDDFGFTGSGHPYIVPYGAYKAKDGYVIVGAFTQSFWRKLCRVINRTDWIDNPQFKTFVERRDNRDQLNELLNEIFIQYSVKEWLSRLKDGDVPHAPVSSMLQAINQPVVLAREMITQLNGLSLFNSPVINLSNTDELPARPAISANYRACLSALKVDLSEINILMGKKILSPILLSGKNKQ